MQVSPLFLTVTFRTKTEYIRNRNYPKRGKTVDVCSVVQIFFQKRVLDEDGYILSVKKNGLQILIPKYGLEGVIYLRTATPSNLFVYNDEV